jgi:hypothetical protein
VPKPFRTESFTLDVYRYKDSLKEDLQQADLVISHAGKVSENLGGLCFKRSRHFFRLN